MPFRHAIVLSGLQLTWLKPFRMWFRFCGKVKVTTLSPPLHGLGDVT